MTKHALVNGFYREGIDAAKRWSAALGDATEGEMAISPDTKAQEVSGLVFQMREMGWRAAVGAEEFSLVVVVKRPSVSEDEKGGT
jgi:hypothetical protein